MCESPQTLEKICLDYISNDINNFVAYHQLCCTNSNILHHIFKTPHVFFNQNLSEQLLQTIQDQGVLTDQILGLFEPDVTRLQKVHIHNASKITSKGLRVLKNHNLSVLSVVGLCNITVNELIGCLGEWTLENLRLLNVSKSTFVNSEKVRIVVALSKLQNLRYLDVSYTEFNSQGLEIIAEDLPFLESIDISGTMIKDIAPLKKCKDKLKYLNMHNLKISHSSNFVSVAIELRNLYHLDISDDKDDFYDVDRKAASNITSFLKLAASLKYLESLDISGIDKVEAESIKIFLKCHPNLKFLGLMQNDACMESMFLDGNHPDFNPSLIVSGYATEIQILESLQRYMHRMFYVQKSLCHLYSHIQTLSSVRMDIIKLILQAMRLYPDNLGIQMATTACLYNLTKRDLSAKIHPLWLKQIADLILQAMEHFPKVQQLQKNILLTLCSDRMLQDVPFNRYRCAELVMNSLLVFDDPAMNRMSVAICSILAAKISTIETSILGANSIYMKKLLEIVQKKMERHEADVMMKFTLSALWNLTDESPRTCQVFLDMDGMNLFLHVLSSFQDENSIETKVLGLLNNIAEVDHLRIHLMKENFIEALKSLLHSQHIDVSYFAAGIVAHMASEGEEFWTCSNITRKEMLSELGSAVCSWDIPETEMVAYRSFSPFYTLFLCFEAYEVQLWAAWAIHHVCSKNPEKYCKMLVEERGHIILANLLEDPDVHFSVAKICKNILEIIKNGILFTDSKCL